MDFSIVLCYCMRCCRLVLAICFVIPQARRRQEGEAKTPTRYQARNTEARFPLLEPIFKRINRRHPNIAEGHSAVSYYSTVKWKQLRRSQLQAKPFCAYCLQLEIRSPATVADHVTPHRGNKALFFDPLNLQSLCKTCHDSAKQRLEKSGVLAGGDVHGMPFDRNHHWNKP